MALPIKTRPSFPFSQSLPPGSFHSPLILIYQRADRMKTTITELTKLMTCTIALSNSMKLWAMACSTTKNTYSRWRVLTKHGPLQKGMANHFHILALRNPWTVWKGKKIGHWMMKSPGKSVPNMILEISGEITLERKKRQSQTKNTQLWMWPVMEVNSDAVKNNVA